MSLIVSMVVIVLFAVVMVMDLVCGLVADKDVELGGGDAVTDSLGGLVFCA